MCQKDIYVLSKKSHSEWKKKNPFSYACDFFLNELKKKSKNGSFSFQSTLDLQLKGSTKSRDQLDPPHKLRVQDVYIECEFRLS